MQDLIPQFQNDFYCNSLFAFIYCLKIHLQCFYTGGCEVTFILTYNNVFRYIDPPSHTNTSNN